MLYRLSQGDESGTPGKMVGIRLHDESPKSFRWVLVSRVHGSNGHRRVAGTVRHRRDALTLHGSSNRYHVIIATTTDHTRQRRSNAADCRIAVGLGSVDRRVQVSGAGRSAVPRSFIDITGVAVSHRDCFTGKLCMLQCPEMLGASRRGIRRVAVRSPKAASLIKCTSRVYQSIAFMIAAFLPGGRWASSWLVVVESIGDRVRSAHARFDHAEKSAV